jgi:hypothetical protein
MLNRRAVLRSMLSAPFIMRVQKAWASDSALPALPFESGAKVMGVGHSFVARSGYTAVTAGTQGITRLDQHTGQWGGDLGPLKFVDNRFNVDSWYDPTTPGMTDKTAKWAGANMGVGGERLPRTLSRLNWCIARRPQIIILDIGGNDINGTSVPLSALTGWLDEMLGLIRAAGIWCVVVTQAARTDWPQGDPRHALQARFNDYIATLSSRDGVRVCDDRAVLAAATDALGADKVMEDGVHLSTIGMWERYKVLLPILRAMVSNGDFYSKDFARDNLSPLGGFLGEAGRTVGVSGTVASGLTATRGKKQNDVILASKSVVMSGVAEKQSFAITPAPSADNANRISTLSLTWDDMPFKDMGLSAGDWVEALVDVELSASDRWLGCVMQLEAARGTAALRQSNIGGMSIRHSATQGGPRLDASLAGQIVVSRFQILSTADGLVETPDRFRTSGRAIVLSWDNQSSKPLTATFSPLIIRKSVDPRPVWHQTI